MILIGEYYEVGIDLKYKTKSNVSIGLLYYLPHLCV